MTENEIAKQIADAVYTFNTRLGPGLLESVYEAVMTHELERRGLKVDRQVTIGINHGRLEIPEAFRADLIVESRVIVELKSVESLAQVHKK